MSGEEAAGIRSVITTQLAEAMRRRDTARIRVLRTVSAAVANAEAVPLDAAPSASAAPVVGAGAADVARRELDEQAARAVVAAELEELEQASRRYTDLGDGDRADRLDRDADVLRELLSR